MCFCVFLSIAVYKKAELAKKTEVQAHSPSRKIILKPAIKYTRPTHLSCVKRKQTGDCTLFSYAMWLANIDFFFNLMAIAAFLFFLVIIPPRLPSRIVLLFFHFFYHFFFSFPGICLFKGGHDHVCLSLLGPPSAVVVTWHHAYSVLF